MTGLPTVHRRRATANRVALFAAAGLLAWLGLTLALGFLGQTNLACSGCHSMRRVSVAAKQSPHASLPCSRCHITTPGSNYLAGGLTMERRIVATLARRSPTPRPDMVDQACRECHHNVLEATVVTGGLAVRHTDLLDRPCTWCHAGTGHRLPSRNYTTTAMDDCMTCHQTDVSDTSGCTICHVGDGERTRAMTSWRVIHGTNWRKTHGAGDMHSCRSCHARDYCTNCHGTPIPHAATWQKGHGSIVMQKDSKSCETCHEKAWCIGCHRTPMPHAQDFLPRHDKVAGTQDSPVCLRCHPKALCDDCHLKSGHPDVPVVEFAHQESLD